MSISVWPISRWKGDRSITWSSCAGCRRTGALRVSCRGIRRPVVGRSVGEHHIASFHGQAVRSPSISAEGAPDRLRSRWASDFGECDGFVGPFLDVDCEAEIRLLVERWIGGRGQLLDSRAAAGRVCDGHGDLQADDIYCLDDGVRVLDCLEFSDTLRYCDVIADVTFLAMDLERLGYGNAATDFLNAYRTSADDNVFASLVDPRHRSAPGTARLGPTGISRSRSLRAITWP